MLVVVILSIFAAISFRKEMEGRGYKRSRVWLFPIIAGLAVIFLGLVLSFIAKSVIKDESSVLLAVYPTVVGIFSILIHGLFVAKIWRQIKKLPYN